MCFRPVELIFWPSSKLVRPETTYTVKARLDGLAQARVINTNYLLGQALDQLMSDNIQYDTVFEVTEDYLTRFGNTK